MSEFAHLFTGNKADHTISNEELISAVRYNIDAEFDAIQLYMHLVESTEDEKAKSIIIDVANEEREHVGEFMTLLKELAPDEEKYYRKGQRKLEALFEKMR